MKKLISTLMACVLFILISTSAMAAGSLTSGNIDIMVFFCLFSILLIGIVVNLFSKLNEEKNLRNISEIELQNILEKERALAEKNKLEKAKKIKIEVQNELLPYQGVIEVQTSFTYLDLENIAKLPENLVFCGKVNRWYILKEKTKEKWILTLSLREKDIPTVSYYSLSAALKIKMLSF